MKKLLMIINPAAGMKQAAKYLADICGVFCADGYETVVAVTEKRDDGRLIAQKRSGDADVVVAVGGDGTFNEVVAGVMAAGNNTPVGYIPAGTTNDFASSLGLSKNLVESAWDIIAGTPTEIDMGSFNGRYFSYIASFGAFTNTSYEVPQSMKNMFGHMAYLLQGATDLLNIKSYPVKITRDDTVYEDKYIFGAICNSTSMGGVLTLSRDVVDMSDGLFETLLIRMPANLIELNQIIVALTSQKYDDCPCISFFSASEVTIEADPSMNWTLDGEYQKGSDTIRILNHHRAIRILTPPQDKKKNLVAGTYRKNG